MKKVLTSTKSPSKLVRKVLSRSSNINKSDENLSVTPTTSTTSKVSKSSIDSSILELEVTSLKEQMAILQMTVNTMHEDAGQKEKALKNLEKQKRDLNSHLKKERNSSARLKKQLQDERDFYYSEKEQYCHEMNECKELKKKLSETLSTKQETDTTEEILECKRQMAKLQDMLNETLEANYNLSVKFMKMKNTKSCLKRRLKQHDLEHKTSMENLMSKFNDMKNDLAEVVDKRLQASISPSNKKYLHVVKQNGILLYHNLCLQMDIENLNNQVDELKFLQFKRDSRISFKHLQKDATTQTDARVRIRRKAVPSKAEQSLTSSQGSASEPAVITVFEKTAKSGCPRIIMLPDDLPGIEPHILISDEGKTRKSSKESVSQFSTLAQCSSTKTTLRALSSPDIIMSSSFLTKDKR